MKKEKQDRICSTKRLKINNRRTVITAIGFYSSEGFSKIIGQKRRKIDTVFCDVNLVDIPLEEIFQGDDARSVQFFARLKKDVESRDKNVLLIIDNPRITTNSIKRIYQLAINLAIFFPPEDFNSKMWIGQNQDWILKKLQDVIDVVLSRLEKEREKIVETF